MWKLFLFPFVSSEVETPGLLAAVRPDPVEPQASVAKDTSRREVHFDRLGSNGIHNQPSGQPA